MMCMKNYNAEKIIFDKFTVFFNIVIFDHYLYTIMVGSASASDNFAGGILKALLAANF